MPTTISPPAQILVVDDEPSFEPTVRDIFESELEQGSYQIHFAANGREALDKLASCAIDLILTDVRMPELDGLAFIERLKQENIPIKIILISAYVSQKDVEASLNNNPNVLEFLTKTQVDINQLRKVVNQLLSSLIRDKLVQGFDYSSLDRETSQFIRQQTEEIRSLMRRTAQSIIDVGTKLIQVKAKLEHGQFGKWLEAEFQWSYPLAVKFMQVAERFKDVNFIDLSIAPSALYLLAAPSLPAEAREEAIERAKQGEPISYVTAKEIKAKHAKAGAAKRGSPAKRSRRKGAEESSLAPPPKDSNPQPQLKSPQPLEIVALRSGQVEHLSASPAQEACWQLGEHHRLYWGHFNSPKFQEQLPGAIALLLAFPPNREDWLDSVPQSVKNVSALFTPHPEQDLEFLRERVDSELNRHTDEQDLVVFAFLPDPQLLLLAADFGCRCYIADPDLARCEAAIAAWARAGGEVVKLN